MDFMDSTQSDKLEWRGEAPNDIAYHEGTPFTGRVEDFYKNGQKETEANYKDGKLDGLETEWYENGQKADEANYKDGKLWTAVVWKPNGEKCPVTNVKDGDGVGVRYNEDGTEKARYTYKDGEVVRD